ncbi:MAG: hypothetical protein FWE45_00625 [Firmicutes bacterium]|nr:hypothetical protein [Bacillota bacterium]
MNEEFDIVSLTPDMSEIWGNILQKIRSGGDIGLYAVCTEQVKVEFGQEEIILMVSSESMHTFLLKYKPKFDDITGNADLVRIHFGKRRENKKTQKLKEIFGDMLKII